MEILQKTFTLILFVGFFFSLHSQALWGDIGAEDFKISAYEMFPDADVVILMDEGDMRIQIAGPKYEFVMERHIRIHILSEKGLDQANREILFKERGGSIQEIVNIKAQTLNYLNGKIETHPLSTNDFFTESQGNSGISSLKFAFKKVRSGSILEFKYTISQQSLFSWNWYFQSTIPTIHSIFTFHPHEFFGHTFVFQGPNQNRLKLLEDYSWEMRNVPSIPDEPFVADLNAYRSRMRVQLNSYAAPNGGGIPILKKWDKFTKVIYQERRFGGLNRPLPPIENVTQSLIKGIAEPEEKLKVIYQYISQKMLWTKWRSIFVDKDLPKVHKEKKGSSAELNLLLIKMLRYAGIEANPMLVSTRDHGAVIKDYPLFSQFNTLLCYAELQNQTFIMDATNPLRPYNLPNFSALNHEGWLLHKYDKEKDGWVKIPETYRADRNIFANITIAESGNLTGSISIGYSGYHAVNYRQAIEEIGEEKLGETLFESHLAEGTIEGLEVVNKKDLSQKLELNVNISSSDFSSKSGNFIYIKPILMFGLEKSPFNLSQRSYPIDFAILESEHFMAYFTIPAGYEVETLPKSSKFGLPNKAMTFQYLCQKAENTIQLRIVLKNNKSYYEAIEYENIKQMYDEMINRYTDQIVLKKINK